ncbi:LysR family transcriptional regulator [Luteibacter sp. dw_328]|uniref:LysR family transcriptional regulator n=1 Tax=Luteibacter sp. dw_328 TaxID=2719796 RepID=UPI0021078A38|nr:LysR family transcriptional regulator [Luteibacter sp. dw_328]
MDRFESMSLLLKVAETGSLSAASRELDIPLATVSRHLSDLETRIGAQILVRSSRRTTLTAAGVAYVASVRRILEQLKEAELTAAGAYSEPKGSLLITAPIVLGRTHMAPLIAEFLQAYPQIDIRMHLSDQIQPLVEKQIDLAVRIGPLPDSGLIAAEVGAVRRVTCASPGYLTRRGTPQTPGDLFSHDCVTFDNLAGADAWRFQEGADSRAVPVHSRLVVNTAEAALRAAEDGVGLTRLLSYQVIEPMKQGRLSTVLSSFELPPWPVHLVYLGQQLLPRKLVAFLDFSLPRLRARFAMEGSLFDAFQ